MESTEEEDSLVEGVDNTDELSSQPSTSEQCRTIQIKRGRPRFEIPGFDSKYVNVIALNCLLYIVDIF